MCGCGGYKVNGVTGDDEVGDVTEDMQNACCVLVIHVYQFSIKFIYNISLKFKFKICP